MTDNTNCLFEQRKQQEEILHEKLEIQLQERVTELVTVNKALQIEIAKVKRSEELARRQIQTLHHTLGAFTAEPRLDKLLDQVLIAIAQQLAVSSCAIWLYNSETETRSLHTVYNQGQILTGTQLLEHQNALEIQSVGQDSVFQANHPLIIYDIANSSYLD